MAMVQGLFDTVPECMIETLLVVHGSGDRNHPEFTQVCERWTCISSPWIRTDHDNKWSIGRIRARWNGKGYQYRRGILGPYMKRGTYTNGKEEGVWWLLYDNVYSKGVYHNGLREGQWEDWFPTGQMKAKTEYLNGEREGKCLGWHSNGQLYCKGVFQNDEKEGEWQWWYDNGQILSKCEYCIGEKVPFTWSAYGYNGELREPM